VLDGQGLCLLVHGIEEKSEAVIYTGDGAAFIQVTFRLLVFRPFLGEVMIGKIRQADHTGILVSVDFFDHIFIPKEFLQAVSFFDPDEKLWFWKVPGGPDAEGDHDLYMDLKQKIRFRVRALEYADRLPPCGPRESTLRATAPAPATIAEHKPPLRIIGSITEDGLGLLDWWVVRPTDSALDLSTQPAFGEMTIDISHLLPSSLSSSSSSSSSSLSSGSDSKSLGDVKENKSSTVNVIPVDKKKGELLKSVNPFQSSQKIQKTKKRVKKGSKSK